MRTPHGVVRRHDSPYRTGWVGGERQDNMTPLGTPHNSVRQDKTTLYCTTRHRMPHDNILTCTSIAYLICCTERPDALTNVSDRERWTGVREANSDRECLSLTVVCTSVAVYYSVVVDVSWCPEAHQQTLTKDEIHRET